MKLSTSFAISAIALLVYIPVAKADEKLRQSCLEGHYDAEGARACTQFGGQITASMEERLTAYGRAAVAYRNEKDIANELKSYNAMLDIHTADPDALAGRGALYASQDKLDLALADFNAGIAANPTSSTIFSARASFYEGRQSWDKAIKDRTEAIRLSASDKKTKPDMVAATYLQRAQDYSFVGNDAAALADCKMLASLGDTWKNMVHLCIDQVNTKL
jgi:tetratricopeptide (TPR) repeat protein